MLAFLEFGEQAVITQARGMLRSTVRRVLEPRQVSA